MKQSISPYSNYRKASDIHGTVLYPGVMVAPMQRNILEGYIGECSRILDPFVGSGTSLYEAGQLSDSLCLYGSDINPLAILITRVKLTGVSSNINHDIDHLTKRLSSEEEGSEAYSFPHSDKWFQPDIAVSLTRVRNAIMEVDDHQNREFFWYMMVDIIRKYCNSRSSTYKLHMREKEQIDRIQNNVIDDYIKKIQSENSLFKGVRAEGITLNQGDSIAYLKSCEDDFFDLCVTSPPYGDNATTVPYGQYSMLALNWIDEKDLDLEGWELSTYSEIDARSLGGAKGSHSPINSEFYDSELSTLISSIREDKQGKVERFLADYHAFLDEMVRVTNGVMVLTLGNRTVDGKTINLFRITKDYLTKKGCSLESESRRSIPCKRTPPRVSKVDGKPVSSMKEEYVLILRKGSNC